MILQHNIKDPNQKMGNNIKLTMWDLIDHERKIHEQKQDWFFSINGKIRIALATIRNQEFKLF